MNVCCQGKRGKHLARLFNSACWWAVNQAWAFDNMPDCTASHASVCPHKAAHDVTHNWSILIYHWPFRGCTGTIVKWLSKWMDIVKSDVLRIMCSSLCLSHRCDVWPPKHRKALPIVAPFPHAKWIRLLVFPTCSWCWHSCRHSLV